uniref:Retrotransposon gag domain-containing protein n=1 Tax=Tanacetum cinerariifolium TaxID=118510 RepID=A0A6L2JLC4_TANCI|nr:hypothetical protein [Tanacetum cinerariifolium]
MVRTSRQNPTLEPSLEPNPNIVTITAQLLQNILSQIVTQVTTNVNNVNRANGNGRNNGCSYKTFTACNPKEFNGKGSAVALTRWIEKIESVFDNSGCTVNQRVRYVASFVNKSLTWWNTQVQERGREAAIGMSWKDFKALLVEEFSPSNEGGYILWTMKIEQYLAHTDYALWEVILNGNSAVQMTKDKADKGYDRFQRLLSLLEIHGAGVSTEDSNQKFPRFLPSAWSNISLIMRNKPDIDNIDIDYPYNNLKVYDAYIKGSSGSSSNSHNVAFVTAKSTSGTNELNAAYSISTAIGHSSEAQEMDLKWQVAMLSMRVKRFYKKTGRKLDFNGKGPVGFNKTKFECFNCHRRGHFARDYRTARNSRNRSRDAGNAWYRGRDDGKRPTREDDAKALVVQDGLATMNDNRTMAEMLRAPTEGYAEAIIVPLILAEQFELKHRAARRWLKKEPPHSITTCDDLVSKFMNEFFPPSRTTNLRNEISNFQQKFDESFHEAWERYKDLLRACPHHSFTELHQLKTFYNTLNQADQDSLNAAACSNLVEKSPQDALTIIKNKSKVRNSRSKPIASPVNACDNHSSSELAKLTHAVKAVEEICVTCGGAHSYYQCLAAGGNTFPEYQDNIQGNYNQGNLGYRPQGVANQMRPPNVQNNQNRFGQPQGFNRSETLPGNTIANPKGELNFITTRSGLATEGPIVPNPPKSVNPEEDECVEETYTDPDHAEYNIKVPPPPPVQKPKPPIQRNFVLHTRDSLPPHISYPSRILKQKQQEKDDIQIQKFWNMFKQLHLNITLAEALILMPKYQKMLKALLSNKEKLQELANTPLNENCSAVILKKLPKNLETLGSLPDVIPTQMTLELASRAICTPDGIARDVFVPVGKFTFLADFVVVDYESNPRVPIILGRPFLRTGRALIDVHDEEMILRDGDERLTLNMKHDTASYSNHPYRDSVNLINIFNLSTEDCLKDFVSHKQSGNPTFLLHKEIASSKVIYEIHDSKGCTFLSEELPDIDSFKEFHSYFDDDPLSGSTTYSANSLLEEFANELALISYPPDYDDYRACDIESDIREIEFLLFQVKDSDFKDSIDQFVLANLNDLFVDPTPEMFTDEQPPDYSFPPRFDVYPDDFLEIESDATFDDDLFDSEGEKIKEAELLIEPLDLPCDILSEYDSFNSQDFSRDDNLPSPDNEDKVFNPGILSHEKSVIIITQVTQEKKLAVSFASFLFEDFDPPIYELLVFKEVPISMRLLPYSSENEEKVFKPGIYNFKKFHCCLLPKLSHPDVKPRTIPEINMHLWEGHFCKAAKVTSKKGFPIDEENSLANDRFKKGKGYHAVPPPLTGNHMPPKSDLSFVGLDDFIYKFKISETVTSLTKNEKDALETSIVFVEKTKEVRTIFTRSGKIPVSAAKPKAAASTSAAKPVNTARPKQSVTFSKSRSTLYKSHLPIRSDEENSLANDRFKKGKGYHAVPPPLTGNHMPPKSDLSFAGLDDFIYKFKISETVTSLTKNEKDALETSIVFVEKTKEVRTIFTRSGKIPVSAAKPKAAASTSAAKPVNAVGPKQSVNFSKSRSTLYKSYSPIRRSFHNATAHSRRNSNKRVNTAGSKAVSAVKRNEVTSVKTSSGGGLKRPVQPARACSYTDFMKCQPMNFKGTKGIVGLSQWLKKMESIFHISRCAIDNQVKFATCTLLGVVLTWWNGHVRTLGHDAAYA